MTPFNLYNPAPGTRAGISAREYQIADHDESFRIWNAGERGVLTRSATGTGKTIMACLKMDTWLQRGDQYRCMVVSYERQLVWQFAQEIEDVLGIHPGIEMESERIDRDSVPKIVVACRASLIRWAPPTSDILDELSAFGITNIGAAHKKQCEKALKLLKEGVDPDDIRQGFFDLNNEPEAAGGYWSRLHKFDWRLNWLVIFDEAHRHAYKLNSVGHIVDWFDQNPESRRNGITATPKRGDEVSLGHKMFPAVALDYPLFSPNKACAVKDGYAVPYLQRYIEVEGVDFRSLSRIKGDFDDAELETVLGEERTLAKLVVPLLDMVGDRRTLIFSPGVEMAKNVARFINARVETKCACGVVKWYPRPLIGDGATCDCGAVMDAGNITKDGDQARELDGSSPEQERRQVYRDHQEGRFQFLSVCGLCIAKGTLVLTDHGEFPIEDVTTAMKLWDGVEFVSHDGVIHKGTKPVIQYAGLTATGDHHVWTDSGWERFAACKQQRIAIRVSGVGGQAVRESCGYYRDDHSTWQKPPGWIGSAVRRMRKGVRQSLQRDEKRKIWMQALRKVVGGAQLVADALSIRQKAVRKSARRLLRRLRRAWNQVPLLVTDSNGAMDHGAFGPSQRDEFGQEGQQQTLRAREYPLGKHDGASEQSATETAEVFDILNAGPRNRFTANGLIVSNCREGYNDPDIACVAVFRPVTKKASSLAEQMKGRGCRPLRGLLNGLTTREERLAAIANSTKPNALIVDLVGITGLADCATTVQIYADGLPDEVAERAEKLIEEDEDLTVEEAVEQAKREDDELREKVKAEREAAERKAKEDAERRAKAGAEVNYTTHEMGIGSNMDPQAATDGQYKFCAFLGMQINVLRSKKQIGRVINQLKQRMDPEEVARVNRIDDWEPVRPSMNQIGFMRKNGIPTADATTKRDASLLIDAKLDPQKFAANFRADMSKVKNGDDLTATAKDLSLVRGVLPTHLWEQLATEGRNRRAGMEPSNDQDW